MKTKKTGPLVLLGLVIGCALILAGCPGPSVGYGTSPDELTGNVSITGTRQVGHQLTANTANLGGSGTISFQWRRGATDILGATGNTYIVQVADAEHVITVRVTRANNSGSVTSIGTAPAVPTPPPHAIVPSQPAGQTHTFAPLPPGFLDGARTAHTVTVRNGGSQPIGPLTVTLSGDYAVSFSLSTPTSLSAASLSTTRIAATASVSTLTIPTIAINGSGAFTVIPNTGLEAGTHTATVTITGANLTTPHSFIVSLAVTAAAIYSISLTPSGNRTFDPLPVGYADADRPTHTVTVTNTGNQPTGALTVTLSGASPSSFSTDPAFPTTIPSIAAGASAPPFTVIPNHGLAVGTHTATVTVGGANIPTPHPSFTVTFMVNPAVTYGIRLSQTSAYTFTAQTVGYSAVTPITVTVYNDGNQATDDLTVALSGASPSSFMLSDTSISSIAIDGDGTFTVGPNTGLPAGTHTATVTVSGGTGITAQSFGVSFTVNPATYGINLSQTDTLTFAAQMVDYGAVDASTITVTNSGNQPTGDLTVALSGASPSSFTLSSTSISSIAVDGDDTFTVSPNTGLAVGTHTATVTVGGANIPTPHPSFTVSFTVTACYDCICDTSDCVCASPDDCYDP